MSKNIIGQKIGELLVISRDLEKSKSRAYYICKCSCGREKSIRKDSLLSGATKSCGNNECQYHIAYERGNFLISNIYDLSGDYGIGYTSKGEKFLFDKEDYYKIKKYTWYFDSLGYLKAANEDLKMHRVVMNAQKGDIVDHIFHNKNDNRKAKLRIVTNSQNQMNKVISRNNTSKYKGISWHKTKSKWIAQIGVEGKLIYLGIFSDLQDAIRVRQDAEVKYFGEYNYKTEN